MLILTEKPSVAAAFAAALGVPRKGGHWENAEFCIVNALGHLLEDFIPEDYDPALEKWTVEALPVIPETVRFKPVEKTADQLEEVKKCFDARKGEPFLLATEAEREGEVIGAEILDYVGFAGRAGAKRFWVSEALTDGVIRSGIADARPLSEYSSYREQGFARQHADWLVGMNLTRLVTLKCGKLLHVGRVQTALLGAVYERDRSIAGFCREKYIEVAASVEGGCKFAVKLVNEAGGEFPTRFPPQAEALAKIEAARRGMAEGAVAELETDRKTVNPPKLFNLTALQKESHKAFSYAPEKTLEAAQSLYEKRKCLSYPRTPSRVMGDGNVELVKNIFGKLKGAFPGEAEGSSPDFISAGNKCLFNSAELQDHHALIPLAPPPEDLAEEEKNVYMLVLKNFFQVLKPPYIYNSVKIKMDIAGFLFEGAGKEVVQEGWKASSDAGGDEDENGGGGLQDFAGIEKGKSYPVSSVEAVEKETEPKKHFTFASLLQLMENPRNEEGKRLAGLGTPATRGAVLKKLADRGYLIAKGKSVLISDDGKFLMENIGRNGKLSAFFSVAETTEWEERLHADAAAFLDGIREFVRSAVAGAEMGAYSREKEALGKCPLCGGEVYEGKKSYYCANYKRGDPCKFAVWKEICGAAVSEADARLLLAGKKTKAKKCAGKSGKEFKASFRLAEGGVEFIFEEKKK